MSSDNATRLLAALAQFGFASLDLQAEDFTVPNQVIQLGYPPNRIDLLTTPDGVDFGTAYRSKVVVEVSGVQVNFIDLENLRLNKRASGRLQDLADLENLADPSETDWQ